MKQVLIFGLDGATYTILDEMIRLGAMPFLERVKAEGAGGVLRSTVPPLTPPAWTSMVTGRTPGHHGITNFLQYSGPQSSSVRIVSTHELKSELIWAMVNRHGLRSGSLNFVAHHPAPKIDGYVIPGWVPWRWIKKYSYPKDLIDRLKARLPGFDVKELAMDFKEENKAIAGAEIEDPEAWILMHLRREQQWFNILRYQMTHDPCELAGIVFDGVDKLQHLLWRYLDPDAAPENPTEGFLSIRSLCRSYFSLIDGFLQEAVQLAGPESLVLIVSDHGFTGSREVVYINTWLAQQGYLTWKEKTEAVSDDSTDLGEPELYHLTAIDMTATSAFASNAASNGIHIPVKGVRGSQGVAPEDYERLRSELTDALLNRCRDPETNRPLVSRVWTREEAFPGPHMEIAPDLTLALSGGGFFSVLCSREVVKKRLEPVGTHHPDGVLLAWGADVRPGTRLEPAQMIDVAPTVLYALGLPVPEDLEGCVIEPIFTPERLARVRPAAGRHTQEMNAANPPAPDEDEDEQQVMNMLRALGYIE